MVGNLYQVEAADNDLGDSTRAILRIEPSGTERFVPRFVVSSRPPSVESSKFPTKRAWS